MGRPDKFRTEILELHGKGLTPTSISKSLGVSDSYIRRILKQSNLTANRSSLYLSMEDRVELISMLKAGDKHKEIAEYFGVTGATVCRIAIEEGLRRRTPYRKANK